LVARPVLRPAVDYELEHQFDPALPELAATRTLVIWDTRGFGLSGTTAPEYTLESSILDMTAVADEMGATSVDVLACLTPAHTAIAFAARYPERVRRLALWNPSLPGNSPRSMALADLPDIVSTHFREYVQLAALKIFGWDQALGAERWANNMLTQFNAETWLRCMESMEQVDATLEAKSVSAPTLVILDHRALDRRTPERVDYVRRLAAALPGAELCVLKPSKPGTYSDVVNEFLGAPSEVPVAATPSGTALIFFADIVDSTALTERMGDAAFREKARELDTTLRATIRENGGTPIEGKLLGDGVLAVFASAAQAIEAALACGRAGGECGLPLHLGLHAGDVIREGDNVYGGAVNVASRISGLSAPGQLLVSATVRDLARTSAGVSFDDRGEHSLKGIEEPVRVYEVNWRNG
jgi:class 3 adenylate cyclase